MSENSSNWQPLCSLVCQNPNIDICNIEEIPKLGNVSKIYPLNWRFLPSIDDQVDILLVRDLDSEISDREVAAVQDFMKSKKDFHIIRDHPHHDIQILGGTWGIKLIKSEVRSNMTNAMKRMFKHYKFLAPRDKAGPDQEMLKRYVW